MKEEDTMRLKEARDGSYMMSLFQCNDWQVWHLRRWATSWDNAHAKLDLSRIRNGETRAENGTPEPWKVRWTNPRARYKLFKEDLLLMAAMNNWWRKHQRVRGLNPNMSVMFTWAHKLPPPDGDQFWSKYTWLEYLICVESGCMTGGGNWGC